MTRSRLPMALAVGSHLCLAACSSADDTGGPVGPGDPFVPGEPGMTGTGGTTTTPTDSMIPTNPALPMDPVVPTNPADPTNPGDPMAMPTDPMDPGDPVEPEPMLTGCGINTGYPGDEYCILPPPPEEGFQVHYGPADYDDPDEVAKYILEPGEETNIFAPAVSGNAEDIYFYGRQYRMRPGSHHLIVSESSGAGSIFGTGRRLGGSQNVAKDNPSGALPPENAGIGMPLEANAQLSLNLHHYNGTDAPILKEAWINFWYVDPATVTQEAKEMFLWAQGAPVLPGTTSTASGSRTITEEGRILTMYGHRHSNNVRFTAKRVRDGASTLALEDYDWEEPIVLEFNSLVTNPTPNPSSLQGGGHTGILELMPGDRLEWECEIVNERDVTITFGENEAATSEMCILVGDAIGPALLGFF